MSEPIILGKTPNPTRRLAALGAFGLFGVLARSAVADPRMAQTAADPENRARTHLHQDEAFVVSPARIYRALLSSREFSALSGERAEIDPRPGGAFSLFNNRVVGRNIDLVINRRIVQAWRVIADWPPGVFSLVHFELTELPTGSSVSLVHSGFQEGDYDHLNAGWAPHYWEPMRRYFERR